MKSFVRCGLILLISIFLLKDGYAQQIDSVKVTIPKCNGGNDGFVTVYTSGFTAPYDFTWSLGAGPAGDTIDHPDSVYSIPYRQAGTMNWVIVDGSGVGESDAYFFITVTEPTPIITDIQASEPIVLDTIDICFGETINFDGNPSGGQGVWKTHTWSGDVGPLTSTNTQLTTFQNTAPAGTYKLIYTVTDTNDCVGMDSLIVVVHATLTGGDIEADDNVCYGVDIAAFTSSAPASGGSGPYTYTWQESTTNPIPGGGGWSDLPASNNTVYDYGNIYDTTYFVRRVVDPECGTEYSDVITITVYKPMDGGDIEADTAVCYDINPNKIRDIASPSGGTGAWSYSWQSQDDCAGGWNVIGGETNLTYDPPNLTETKCYRRVATNTCGTVYSDTVTITVYDSVTGGEIEADDTICYNDDPAMIVNDISPTGGDMSFTYEWEYQNLGGGVWNVIGGATDEFYDPSNLTQSRLYRRKAINLCDSKYSDTVTVIVYPDEDGGTIAADTTICYGIQPDTLRSIAPASGGDGVWTYLWYSDVNCSGTWVSTGVTTEEYRPPVLTNTTCYRRRAINACGNRWSNIITVTVLNILDGGDIEADTSVCYNIDPNKIRDITSPSGGSETWTYAWQSQDDCAGGWNVIGGETALTYDPSNLTETKCYRRVATDALCGTVYSDTVIITVYDSVTGGEIEADDTICYNDDPAMIVNDVSPTGGDGSFTYEWEYQNLGGGVWNVIGGATDEFYDPSNLTQSRLYRRKAINLCDSKYSDTVTVIVYPDENGGTIAADTTICYGIQPDTLRSIAPASGGDGVWTYLWYSDVNCSGTWVSTGVTTEKYRPPVLTNTTCYRRRAYNACGNRWSNIITVTVLNVLDGGDIEADTSVCYNINPNELRNITSPSGGSETWTYAWQSQDDCAGGWNIIGGETDLTYDPSNLTETKCYRRVATDALCGTVYSDTVTITVADAMTGGLIGSDQTICEGVAPAGLTNDASPTGGFIPPSTYDWEYQNPGDVLWTSLGVNSPTYNPPVLYDTTYYRRIYTNLCGTVISDTVTINVNDSIVISSQPVSDSVCQGDMIQFNVIAGGTGIAYRWQKYNAGPGWQNLNNGGGRSGVFTNTLTINPVNPSHEGAYRCYISGTCDDVISDSVNLWLHQQTQITVEPTDQEECEAQSASFNITAIGTGIIRYVWQKQNGAAWDTLTDGGDISGATTNTLTIADLDAAYDTNYRCIVHSDCGPDQTSVVVSLTVNPLPIVSFSGLSSPYCEGIVQDTLYGNPQDANGTFTGIGIADQGDGTAFFTPLTNGTYNITYTYTTFPEGCTDSSIQSVTVFPAPDTTLPVSDDVVCFNEDAQIVVSTSENNVDYVLRWDSDDRVIGGMQTGDGSDITFIVPSDSLSTGVNIFNIYATTPDGCSEELNNKSTVTKLTTILTTIFTDSVDCNGNSTGSAAVVAVGGTGPGTYTYLWTPTAITDSNITNQPAGIYAVEVTDGNGCVAKDTAIIGEPAVLAFTYTKTDVTCFGASDGAIIFTATGGTRPYRYSINGDIPGFYVSDSAFTGLDRGEDYYLIVQDTNSCKTPIVRDTITEPAQIDINYSVFNISGCNGDSTGSIQVNATGGTGDENLLCAITTTATTNPDTLTYGNNCDYNNIPAGDYWVFVKDTVSNCIEGVNGGNVLTITEPPPITFSVTSHIDVTVCSYNTNGSITVSASGGSGSLHYWINGSENLSVPRFFFQNLGVGIYLIEIIDDNGCLVDTTINITGPPPIVIDSVKVDSASCYNALDGSITVYGSGGTPGLSYSINGAGGPFQGIGTTFAGLGANTYNIRIVDANGCIKDTTLTVFQPAPIIITSPVEYTPITCYGADDGQIIIDATGGAGGLTYSITGGAPYFATDTFSNLPPDTFYVAVQDVNGCEMFSDTIILVQPDSISIDSTEFTNITCHDVNDGTITVYASGGTGGLTYSLYNSVPALVTSNGTGIFNSLTADTFTVEVDDGNNCGPKIAGPFIIVRPDTVFITVDSAHNVTCNGLTDGAIYTTSGGGTGTLVYTLYNSVPDSVTSNLTGDFTGLPADDYTITVTDSMGCSETTPIVMVIEPDTISFIAQTATDVTCFGDTNGTVYVEPTGGTAPYRMILNTVPADTAYGNNATFTDLGAGSYVVEVTDTNNCATEYTDTLVITQPSLLTLDSTQLDTMQCNGGSATITIYSTGDMANIEYSIDSGYTFVASNVFSVSTSDTLYTVVQYNTGNCTAFGDTIIVTEPTPVVVTTIDTTHITGCAGDNTGALQVSAAGGGGIYTYIINTVPADTNTTGIFDTLIAGDYVVTVYDQNNCSGTSNTITVFEPPAINVSTSLTHVACNQPYGEIDATGTTGGYTPYVYILSGDAADTNTTGIFDTLAAGNYVVEVYDTAGCVGSSGPIVIIESPPFNFPGASYTDITCAGVNDGTITINTPTGGTPYSDGTYRYSIDGGTTPVDNNGNFTSLSPGIYTPAVIDSLGCVAVSSTTIEFTAKTAIILSIVDTASPTCNLGGDGLITISATGGTPYFDGTYRFDINDGIAQNNGSFIALEAGVYNIDVVDSNNCEQSIDVELVNPPPVVISGSTEHLTGSITITVESGATGPYLYRIFNFDIDTSVADIVSSSYTFSGLDDGIYVLEVTDSKGCFETDQVELKRDSIIDSLKVHNFEFVIYPQCPEHISATASYTLPDDVEYPVRYSFDNAPYRTNFADSKITQTVLVGQHTVHIYDSLGREFYDTILVEAPDSIEMHLTVSNVSCNYDVQDGGLRLDSITGGTPFEGGSYYYYWNKDTNLRVPELTALDTGTYGLYVYDLNGCSFVDSTISIAIDTFIYPDAGPDTVGLCWYYEEHQLSASGGRRYEWIPDETVYFDTTFLSNDTIFNPVFSGDTSMRYFVKVKKEECYHYDTVTIVVEEPIGLNIDPDILAVQFGETATLTANKGSLYYYFWWGPDSTVFLDPHDTIQEVTIDIDTFFIAYGISDSNCIETDTIAIEGYGTIEFIPSGFTPNGDLRNDVWIIPNGEYYENMVVNIFNRWGELVYQNKGYYDANNAFDGTRNKNDLPSGTYYYVIYPNEAGYEPISGTVTIIR